MVNFNAVKYLNLTNYQLITVDLDDTLWECFPVILKAEQTLFDWLAKHYPTIVQGKSVMSMRDERLLMLKQQPSYQFDLTQLRLDSLQFLAKQHGYLQPKKVAQQAFEVFITARNQISLFEDAQFFLSTIKQSKCKLAAITNGNADIERIGISHFFDASVKAEQVAKGKPHADMFNFVLNKLAIDKQHCVHIGDDAYSDGLGANNANIDFIWLNRKNQTWPAELKAPILEVSTFNELIV